MPCKDREKAGRSDDERATRGSSHAALSSIVAIIAQSSERGCRWFGGVVLYRCVGSAVASRFAAFVSLMMSAIVPRCFTSSATCARYLRRRSEGDGG